MPKDPIFRVLVRMTAATVLGFSLFVFFYSHGAEYLVRYGKHDAGLFGQAYAGFLGLSIDFLLMAATVGYAILIFLVAAVMSIYFLLHFADKIISVLRFLYEACWWVWNVTIPRTMRALSSSLQSGPKRHPYEIYRIEMNDGVEVATYSGKGSESEARARDASELMERHFGGRPGFVRTEVRPNPDLLPAQQIEQPREP
jgi:hypothetical protein